MSKKAVVLLSGGLDSATYLAIAKSEGFECYALSFAYGQRHRCELRAAENVAAAGGVKDHVVINIDLRKWGGSALTDDIAVPERKAAKNSGIPVTYVPARNLIFLSLAAGWAEVLGARDIFIGVNSVDFSGYPDCRPRFIEAFQNCATIGTKAEDEGWKFNIHAPLQFLNKAEIITRGTALGVDYSLTRSCYNPAPYGQACGKCDSCHLRRAGFARAGIKDPAPYVSAPQ
ncbi:MAG: 7-cyano-7-deazaguanine synthase QueC [Victivallaceae bacterium]|nr:7-cyano-7-deazaguanine synthase QueC [Victivallaceae bacterium]